MNVVHHPWVALLRSMRFMQLTFFLLLGLMIQALFDQQILVSVAISVFYLNAIIVTLSATDTHRYVRNIFIGLWILTLIAKFLPEYGAEFDLYIFIRVLTVLLLLFCVYKISHYVFFKQMITMDSLFATVVIYLLIASLFAQLYSLIYFIEPSCIVFPEGLLDGSGHLPEITFTYFSFVTLATLGYGDIVPHHPVTQMLASIEAIIGQFYVAIVVARLMSLYAAEKRKSAG